MAQEGIKSVKCFVLLTIIAIHRTAVSAAIDQPAVPDFGPNVLIFDPSMTSIQSRINAIFLQQERSEFGTGRYAYFFKPGAYRLDVQLGFYMDVVGLGQSPDAVSITGAVRSKAAWMKGNATVNFWRSIENISVVPTRDHNIEVWAVSQGTAIRRTHVRGNLNLWDNGWSSGGFMADCKIDGQVTSGSQQQWFSRNSDWNRWNGGVWNMVFLGTIHPPQGAWPERPYTVVDQTPLIREKPYLFIDESGHYFVMVPCFQSHGSVGTSWSTAGTPGTPLPIDRFYLAHPGTDGAASINAALARGQNLILTPGIYHLQSPLRVTGPNTVVLGLGYPTLIPDNGSVAMMVSDVDGVEVGGILFQAGPINSPNLLQIGPPGSSASHANNPSFFYDIFCRAGGAAVGKATCFVTINSNHVVAENLWLWRADHGKGVQWNANMVQTGLTVNGNNVTLYGLFVEHCQGYQTLWNGNGGRVYFYQSEMPYDPPSQAQWRHQHAKGFASYKVADSVLDHQAWGLGVYCVFLRAPVIADNAIETPDAPGIRIHHIVTIRLGGVAGSGMEHVINGNGGPVLTNQSARVD